MKKSKKILWILLFLVSGILYYLLFGEGQTIGNVILGENDFIREEVFVKRVIDGDTVELEDLRKVRMLGINTPEKGKFMSNESILFTKNLENKSVFLEYQEKDKYGRVLGYLFLEEISVNEELVRIGLAHSYYYAEDHYSESVRRAEALAREEKIGIWQDSNNFGCIELVELKYEEDNKRCTNREQLKLDNQCNEIEVLIKDDATHEFVEKIPRGRFVKNFSCVFNDAGDSLFIWDDSGLLIFYRY